MSNGRDIPLFVVVGNVNQGKSSVVAALSESGTVPIDSYPGTTKRSGTYAFRVIGEELFHIIDTPGFQRARHALAWLQLRAGSVADRPAAVRAFVETFAGSEEFQDEVELLRPILDGAGILYVVDASSHLEPSSEAEMEILRWTGQPAMALINRIRARDHAEEWRPTLRQFFHIVREFDAHEARFVDRVDLIRGFREIRPEWSAAIDTATTAMQQDWAGRQRQAAAVITDLMVDAISCIEQCPRSDGSDEKELRRGLEENYRQAQRRIEATARDEIQRIYGHPDLERDDPELELLQEDLFAEEVWRAFGLNRTQLIRIGAGWGAAIGAGIDLAVGGASFFLGAAIGAGIGATTLGFGGQHIAKAWSSASKWQKALLPMDTGRFLAMGPVTNPRFAWILLDRALVHCRTIRDRSHARRDTVRVAAAGVVRDLPGDQRDAVDVALRGLLRDISRGRVSETTRAGLQQAILNIL
jgi:hypothetical protein